MKVTLSKTGIENAPKGFTRIAFVTEKGVRRLVRERGIDTIELSLPERLTRRTFVVLCRTVITAAKQFKARKIAIAFTEMPEGISPAEALEITATNIEMANFEFRSYRTRPKEGWGDVEEVLVCGVSGKGNEEWVTRGRLIGEAVNACRELANTPGGDITPRGLANAAKTAVKGLPVTVSTIGRAQIEKLGMGLLAGVGAGSAHEPTFTVMEYKGAAGKPIVIAGKGITFDSGGLNLKPSNGIYEMHMDMSGGAAVIHTIALAARLKLKRHVIGLIPSAENMLGSNAMRPGDILTSLSGKTVEVTDTDAEGRLVLADAITYAKRFKPSVVLDVATLTGAAHIALGHYASGLMTRDEALGRELLARGETSGDYLWPLPLWDEYESVIKSDFADMQNHSISQGRYGGATNGAIFLWQFAKELDCPWAHIDIAPRMTAAPGEELAKGAAGTPVRLLISFIESWKA